MFYNIEAWSLNPDFYLLSAEPSHASIIMYARSEALG